MKDMDFKNLEKVTVKVFFFWPNDGLNYFSLSFSANILHDFSALSYLERRASHHSRDYPSVPLKVFPWMEKKKEGERSG